MDDPPVPETRAPPHAELVRASETKRDAVTASPPPPFVVVPAVDIAGGLAVRLVQGEAGTETSYGAPVEAALAWQGGGAQWVHLVDIDAAFGRGTNRELIAEVVGRLDVAVELSGGIRDDGSLAAALATGCARVNLGTAALERPDWVRAAMARHGDRIAVGLDVRGTTLSARGWTQDGGELFDVLSRLDADGCARYVRDRRPARRDAHRAEPRSAAPGVRRDGPAGDRERWREQPRRPPCARRASARPASRARSSARRSTPGPSRCPRRSPRSALA